jgi:DnaD/phage-associated family protein
MPEAAVEDGVTIPGELFDQLSATQDLSELKAVLFVLRLSGTGATRAVPSIELHAPRVARTIAGPHHPEGAEKRVQRALDRAVTNGALLRVTVGPASNRQAYLLPATRHARALVDRLRGDDSDTAIDLGLPAGAEIGVYRPNVFAFYEQHLGPLTPLVADQLRDAERSYPRIWIEEAIIAAADSNTRSWRYVETILSRWEETGAPGPAGGKPLDGR